MAYRRAKQNGENARTRKRSIEGRRECANQHHHTVAKELASAGQENSLCRSDEDQHLLSKKDVQHVRDTRDDWGRSTVFQCVAEVGIGKVCTPDAYGEQTSVFVPLPASSTVPRRGWPAGNEAVAYARKGRREERQEKHHYITDLDETDAFVRE